MIGFCFFNAFLTSFSFSKVGCKYQILQPNAPAPSNTYMHKVPHTIKLFTTMSDYMETISDSQIDLPHICLDLLYEPCARR